MPTEEVILTLNDLIAICKDGEKGYHAAAEAVDKYDLRALFEEYAVQRRQFAAELQEKVLELCGSPERAGDISGMLHRNWIGLKGALTNGRVSSIIAECEFGEKAALESYDTARARPLPRELFAVVDQQYQAIKSAYDRLKNLQNNS